MRCFLPTYCRRFNALVLVAALAFLPCVLGAFPFGNSEPAGANELKQGDAAASFGDTARAEKFYGKAKKLCQNNLTLWSECVSRLGTIYLRRNDIAAAKKLLAEFRQRIPAGSAGTLPGEIMAAEGDLSGAEKVFDTLIKRNDIVADRAKFFLADVRMKQHRYQEALDMYNSLRQSRTALVGRMSEYAWVIAALQLGKFQEAREMLDKAITGSGDKNFKKLRLLCAVKEGDFEYFRKNWNIARDDIHADNFMCSLAELAAELAEKKGEHKYASQLYESAFSFAIDEEKKREIIGKLFSCCAIFDAGAAAQVAARYAQLFPDASDRALLLIQSGRLLVAGGNFKKAVEFYAKVMNDKDNLLIERKDAALEGASAAEQGGFFQEADNFYQQLIILSHTSGETNSAKLKYAGFLLRRKSYLKADEILLELAADIHTATGENAAYRLLQSKSMQNSLSENELNFAEVLKKSKNRIFAEFGSFVTAEIFNLSGRSNDEARKKYLNFISSYPESKFAAQAHFQAARLAGKKGDFVSAAGEFVAFAGKFPEHQNSAAARFLAVDSYCRAGMDKEAETELKKLAVSVKYIEAFTSGIMTYGEHLLQNSKADRALELINGMISQHPEYALEKRSDIIFLKARVLHRLKDYTASLKELDTLTGMPDNTAELAEAHYLAGNICSDIFNDFEAAEKNFSKACQLKKDGVPGFVYSGRLADCRYSMYLQTNDSRHLESAENLYRHIAENAVLPDMRIQANYKAGLCREVCGDHEKALEDYEQTLYFALTVRSFGVTPQQTWCEKAAYAAIEIALRNDEFGDTDKAQQLLAVYRKLGYENSERDFQVLRRKVRERQKLLNRGAGR